MEERIEFVMKRIILATVFFISLLFVFNCVSVYASNNSAEKVIERDLQMYAIAISDGKDNIKELQFSTPIQVSTENNNDNHGGISFVMNNGKCVGYITVIKANDCYYTNFTHKIIEAVDRAMVEGKSVTAYIKNAGGEDAILDFIINENSTRSNLVLNNVPINIENDVANISSSTNYASLNIPFVSNTSINGRGICWAACIAAVANYRHNYHYTASGVYYSLQTQYSGNPEGSDLWFNRGFQNIILTNCVKITSNLYYYSLYPLLQSDKPVIFDVYNSNETVGHSIVCRYAYKGTSSVMYGFMDPNFAGESGTYRYVTITGTNGNLSNFVYAPNGETGTIYTKVKACRYENEI